MLKCIKLLPCIIKRPVSLRCNHSVNRMIPDFPCFIDLLTSASVVWPVVTTCWIRRETSTWRTRWMLPVMWRSCFAGPWPTSGAVSSPEPETWSRCTPLCCFYVWLFFCPFNTHSQQSWRATIEKSQLDRHLNPLHSSVLAFSYACPYEENIEL